MEVSLPRLAIKGCQGLHPQLGSPDDHTINLASLQPLGMEAVLSWYDAVN